MEGRDLVGWLVLGLALAHPALYSFLTGAIGREGSRRDTVLAPGPVLRCEPTGKGADRH